MFLPPLRNGPKIMVQIHEKSAQLVKKTPFYAGKNHDYCDKALLHVIWFK